MVKRTSCFLAGRGVVKERQHFIWNSISGLMNALQATFILFVLMRIGHPDTAGLFTLAFATSNLMLVIGKYGVRYFQISDVGNKYSFDDYFLHRVFLCLIMLIVSALFCVFSFLFDGYTSEKAWVCFGMCLLKMIDAIEDVFGGEYQRQGRLDVAGRTMTVRLLITISSFIAGFAISKSLLTATGLSFIASLVYLTISTYALREFAEISILLRKNIKKISELFASCFPLFFSSFILMFTVNMPKYAIDHFLSAESQAVYGFVSMPVFVVGLLAEFFFRPLATRLSLEWNKQKYKEFKRSIFIMVLIICGITVVCIVGGVIFGVPVLSFLYNYELRPYWKVLAILLCGGGILSLTSFLTLVLTIVRVQNTLTFPYLLTALVSLIITNIFVNHGGLTGAALAYFLSMSVLCICILMILVKHLKIEGEQI